MSIHAALGLRDVPQARFATASATLRTTSTLGFANAVAISSAAAHLGPVVAYRRTWAFGALTLIPGATFCRFSCLPGSFTAQPPED